MMRKLIPNNKQRIKTSQQNAPEIRLTTNLEAGIRGVNPKMMRQTYSLGIMGQQPVLLLYDWMVVASEALEKRDKRIAFGKIWKIIIAHVSI
jgi:hypothetical protein